MNKGRIFLVNPQKKQLMPMAETPYAQEVVLQEYLAAYPDLLAGDQIDPENPRRWLLVKREIGIPGSEEGGNIWSLDHLFLDQDGIPTFVECKRISDTRIRREVVAQMLDYAANGTAYWPVDRLRQAATETAAQNNLSLDEELARLLEDDDEETIDGFWEKVEQNLRDGIVRLLFVADETPRELRRLVEFLNAKMNDVEVLAVEIKQFLGQGQTALVPRVIGASEAARAQKRPSRGPRRTRKQILAECTKETAGFFATIMDLAEAHGHVIRNGRSGFSIRFQRQSDGTLNSFAYGFPPDRFELYLRDVTLTPDGTTQLRQEILALDIFEEGGQHTLRCQITDVTLPKALTAFELALAFLDNENTLNT